MGDPRSKSTAGGGRQRPIAPILPRPQRATRRKGELRLEPGTPLLLPSEVEPLSRRALVAAEDFRRQVHEKTGIDIAIARERPGPHRSRKPPAGPAILCTLERGAAIAPRTATARDAYRLRVRPSGVVIAAPTPDGIRHGLQTLTQLVTPAGRVPAIDVLDQPDYRDRGIMLDVSRGKVPTRQTLEDLVDLCCRLRLNVLMLYVEHTFAFRRHPEIGAGSSPLDAETILALDAYADDRGVELVPCLQSLGHMERVLSIDRYKGLAESEKHWSVSPGHDGTYRLLDDLYSEFLPLFRSKRFNANCDEPFDLGRGLSTRRAPGKTPGRLFADHVNKLRALSSDHDKKLMIWADFAHKHPAEIPRLDRDVVLLDWWYEADFDADRIRALRRKGFEVWGCPGTSSWNCLFPRIGNSLDNISRWADAGRRHGASGLLNTDWGDFGHYNPLGVSLYGYAWSAQQAWSGPETDTAFDRAFASQVFGETGTALGRLHRRLGSIHDAGFRVANGSPLQYLYFDALGRSFFLQHARREALEKSARRIESVRVEIDRLELARGADDFTGLAGREIAWAAEATAFAIQKSLAAIDYNAWRENPGSLSAGGRRRLAKRLEALAVRQSEQAQRLESLWLARSAPSDFDMTRKRLRRSIAGLRAGARRLRKDTPGRFRRGAPPALLDVYNEVRRETGMPPR